ncbi:MAG: GNAT family N-acetyltransferase [Pseudomonadales bacterium]
MLKIRKVEKEDCQLIFQWRNLPFIMNLGGLRKTVTLDEHTAWFHAGLKSNDRLLYITVIDGENSGLTRFDKSPEGATVSIYLLEEFTGKGLGIETFQQAYSRMLTEWPETSVIAEVQLENIYSQKFFQKLGFKTLATDELVHFRLESI